MKEVTGYFASIYQAQRAISLLNEQGFKKTSLDIVDRFSNDTHTKNHGVLSVNNGSLSTLVLKPEEGVIPMEQRPLYAADPHVSGMGRFSEIADANIIITVKAEDNDENRIIEIIKQNDGEI